MPPAALLAGVGGEQDGDFFGLAGGYAPTGYAPVIRLEI